MSQPFYGAIQTLAGTALVTGYTASTTLIQPARSNRIRFYVESSIASGSTVVTVTVKAQFRYNDGTTTGHAWMDLPTYLDDVQGSAQPKGPTFQIDQPFTVSANATFSNSFYLDIPFGICELRTAIKTNATGAAADTVSVYAVAG